MTFIIGILIGVTLGLFLMARRVANMDWYYTQDREKRLRDIARLDARVTELDHRLRQRIHKEVQKSKKMDNDIHHSFSVHAENITAAFKAINELQARGRMNGK